MKKIAFVPVRAGSKSIPHKNIKQFCGRPLVYWVLSALQGSSHIDEIFVATDGKEIKDTVNGFGFPKVNIFDRGEENAHDTASTESAMMEFLEARNFSSEDVFVLVQATSPFTQSRHIDEALAYYEQNKEVDSLLSCVRTKRFFWEESGVPINYDYTQRPRRQDFKGVLMENGAFYINTVGNILESSNRLSGKIGMYEMDEYTHVEIDDEHDWVIAEELMKKYILKEDRK